MLEVKIKETFLLFLSFSLIGIRWKSGKQKLPARALHMLAQNYSPNRPMTSLATYVILALHGGTIGVEPSYPTLFDTNLLPFMPSSVRQVEIHIHKLLYLYVS